MQRAVTIRAVLLGVQGRGPSVGRRIAGSVDNNYPLHVEHGAKVHMKKGMGSRKGGRSPCKLSTINRNDSVFGGVSGGALRRFFVEETWTEGFARDLEELNASSATTKNDIIEDKVVVPPYYFCTLDLWPPIKPVNFLHLVDKQHT